MRLKYPYPIFRCPWIRLVHRFHCRDEELDQHHEHNPHWRKGIERDVHFEWTQRFGHNALIFMNRLGEQRADISKRQKFRFSFFFTETIPTTFPSSSVWSFKQHCRHVFSNSSNLNCFKSLQLEHIKLVDEKPSSVHWLDDRESDATIT